MPATSIPRTVVRSRGVPRVASDVVGLLTLAGAVLALRIELGWLLAAEGGPRRVGLLCVALGLLAMLAPVSRVVVAGRIVGFAAIAVGFPAVTLTFINERAPLGVERVAAVDAIGTAVAASQAAFTAADTVVLIGSRDTANAYVAGSLASSLGGPLLITDSSSLRRDTVKELDRLGAKRAVVVGDAPSPHIERRLRWLGMTVSRIPGSPVAVAASIASRVSAPSMLVVVDGRDRAAALDVAGDAASAILHGVPIVRATPDGVPLETASVILTQRPEHVIVQRTTGAVADDLRELDVAITSRATADPKPASRVWIASGAAPMDVALASTAAAAAGDDVLVLHPRTTANATVIPQPLRRYAEIMVVGGTAAVSDEAVSIRL